MRLPLQNIWAEYFGSKLGSKGFHQNEQQVGNAYNDRVEFISRFRQLY